MSATADPYDWPMPNRRDCMSLQTLSNIYLILFVRAQ